MPVSVDSGIFQEIIKIIKNENLIFNVLPAGAINNVHDRAKVNAIDFSNGANKSVITVVAGGQLFVCIHLADLTHLCFI